MPVYNGLTNEWHPTQMLADFLTMHEASNKPYDRLAYAYVGDCRFNMGRSLLVMGALMGSDVRLAGPAELHPPEGRRRSSPRTSPAAPVPAITVTDDPAEAVAGVDFIHTDVWVSMGEAKDVWTDRVRLLRAVPGQRRRCWTRPGTRRSSSCTACRPSTTPTPSSAREIMEHTGMTAGLEVTNEVFESAASIVFDQAENRLHTIKAILVATLA